MMKMNEEEPVLFFVKEELVLSRNPKVLKNNPLSGSLILQL